ncbi:protein glass isoform X2 [Condylostylus longicornis]|uniref:protein glass isoform X2 n=1 Tax=Condylostylus longicornis TaxID=2530218 RepID=UPI00244E1A7A|nr:protein glass isoform X2 [Condylostylus longicornis]
MYISCKVTSNAPLEPEAGYVPNNPLFGISFDSPQECLESCSGCISCQNNTSIPPIHTSDLDCESCFDQNLTVLSSSQGNSTTNYWNTEEMSSFPGLPPLDIDPLPSLFPFSPSCSASYNFSAPQTSLSYTVHPQMLLSPSHHHFNQSQTQNTNVNSQTYYDGTPNQLGPPSSLYPSVSVNVNMTMHGYPPAENTVPLPCSQWTPNSSSSVNVLYPQLLSPSHYSGGATYSFTADFRAPSQGSQQPQQQQQQPQQLQQQSQALTSFTDSTNKLSPTLSQKSFHQHTIDPQSPSKSPLYLQDTENKTVRIGFDEDEESNEFEESESSKPNLCRLCGKSYARPSTLKTHLRTHSGERPYRCTQCNKSFSQAANLTAHLRTHTGQKPFNCNICGRRFSQSSSVTTHMRTHSGERPYRCRFCKKAFSDSSTLTKHLRIHSGEKPYQCKLCYLRFSQSGNLNRHMRVHGNNTNVIS